MLPHHAKAADAAVERLTSSGEPIAVYLGGSIAKGLEREDSDVDLIVIVGLEVMEKRRISNSASFLWTDLADWEGGYVEGRYLSREFVREAVDRGSEPTRWSFVGARKLWGSNDRTMTHLSLKL